MLLQQDSSCGRPLRREMKRSLQLMCEAVAVGVSGPLSLIKQPTQGLWTRPVNAPTEAGQ